MNREYYLKSLAKTLYPTLRSEDFNGSGTTLRRLRGPLIHVFNVQGSSDSRRCYMNLGAHLDFLPSGGGRVCDPKKIKEYECAFRGRMEPPPGMAFGWGVWRDGPGSGGVHRLFALRMGSH